MATPSRNGQKDICGRISERLLRLPAVKATVLPSVLTVLSHNVLPDSDDGTRVRVSSVNARWRTRQQLLDLGADAFSANVARS
jgi:hypothetical protein